MENSKKMSEALNTLDKILDENAQMKKKIASLRKSGETLLRENIKLRIPESVTQTQINVPEAAVKKIISEQIKKHFEGEQNKREDEKKAISEFIAALESDILTLDAVKDALESFKFKLWESSERSQYFKNLNLN